MAERGVDVVRSLMGLGVMATVNQSIDADTAELVVAEFGHRLRRVSESDVEIGLKGDLDDASESGCELVIHLGMTGRLSVSPAVDLAHPHLRAWWRLDDDDALTLHDVRRFGRVHVVSAGRYETIATLNRLGPEPFSEQFTGEGLWRALRASRRCIKTQLLSQRPVAGVGNIYADEALWLAGVNPATR